MILEIVILAPGDDETPASDFYRQDYLRSRLIFAGKESHGMETHGKVEMLLLSVRRFPLSLTTGELFP
ncbi:MAG: hypothetical protein KKG53_13780 [Proteobacteria bacterium]|nr:hypothetical protein [Pseudomonadota bacterium]